jgi:hypothetical protein
MASESARSSCARSLKSWEKGCPFRLFAPVASRLSAAGFA